MADVLEGPTHETGLWLFQHAHEWSHLGYNRDALMWWHPVFGCTLCTDVIEDMSVPARHGTPCPSKGCWGAVGHGDKHSDGINTDWELDEPSPFAQDD